MDDDMNPTAATEGEEEETTTPVETSGDDTDGTEAA